MAAGARRGGDGFAPALTSFVGRVDEIDRLTRLLSSHRLVTVTGPGGVGKTRVVVETTDQLVAASGMRIWVVELAAVGDAGNLPSVIATQLGCGQRPGRSAVQSITALLVSEPGLLVLDNCEHLADAVADLCAQLLADSDDTRILATSREPIGVSGEARLRLGPLESDSPQTAGSAADGVRLFAERARLIDPDFRLTPDTTALVAGIVGRLGGLPLAIELAAARYQSMGLTALLQRLDQDPLEVLSGGPRGAPARHRSLRATIDWSYQLLSPAQQRVLRRLAVFPGPFTLAAAEAVAGREALAVLPGLVDCSLLSPPSDFLDGRPRFLMLEAVSDFAHEQLNTEGAEQEALAAMVSHAVEVAESAAAGIGAAGREEAAAGLFDIEDLLMHRALRWAHLHDPAAALRIALALAPWWQLRGRSLGGYPLLRDALAQAADSDGLGATAQVWLGRLAHSVADWATALDHFASVCEGAGATRPTKQQIDALTGRSGTMRNLSRLAEATADAEAALSSARQLGYLEGVAQALVQLSVAASYAGDQQAATRWAREAATVDPAGLPDRVSRRVAIALTMAYVEVDRLEIARRTCAEGLASARRAGDLDMQADFLYFTTHIALQAADFDHVGAPIGESLRLATLSGDRLRLLDCLEDCARLCAATGRPAEALTLWAARRAQGKAANMPELAQDARRRNPPLRQARAQLGPDATDVAEQRGTRMSLTAAAELASLMAATDARQTNPATSTRLSPRERELLTLVAGGRTDAQIAEELFISIRTVRSHLDRIRDKTGSRRRADLTRLAVETGLI